PAASSASTVCLPTNTDPPRTRVFTSPPPPSRRRRGRSSSDGTPSAHHLLLAFDAPGEQRRAGARAGLVAGGHRRVHRLGEALARPAVPLDDVGEVEARLT